MADVAERLYRLTVDANPALREMKKLNKTTEEIDGRMAEAGRTLKAAFAGVAVGATLAKLSGSLREAADRMDDLTKSASRLGIPVDDLTRLNYAAELSGVSAEQLGTGIRQLTVGMQDLVSGGTSEAVKSISSLGIEVQTTDGRLRGSSEVFGDLAEKFQAMPDGAQKSALAIKIFGESGASMVPLLNAGREGIEAMGDEAERLGITFDAASGKMSEAFNDNITRMGSAFEGIQTKITEGLLPALISVTDEMVDSTSVGDDFVKVGLNIGKALLITKNVLDILGNSIANVYELFAAWGTSLGETAAALTSGDFANIPDIFKDNFVGAFEEITVNAGEMGNDLNDIFKVFSEDSEKQLAETRKNINEALKGKQALTEKAAENLAKQVESLRAKLDPSAKAANDYRDAHLQLSEAVRAGLISTEEYGDLVSKLEAQQLGAAESLGSLEDQFTALERALDPTIESTIEFEQNLKLLDEALKQNIIDTEKHKDLVGELTKAFRTATNAGNETKSPINTNALKAAEKAAENLAKQVESLRAKLDPSSKAANDFRDAYLQLNEAVRAGLISTEEYGDLVSKLEAQQLGAAESLGSLEDQFTALERALDPTIEATIEFEQNLKLLDEALNQNIIDTETHNEMVGELTKAFRTATNAGNETKSLYVKLGEALGSKMKGAVESTSDALFDLATKGKADFKEMTISILEDIGRMILKMTLLNSMEKVIGGSPIGGFLGIANAQGNAFDSGQVVPFASGGIINGPTMAPMALMGEAGPEAIVPLRRGPDGDLGVGASPVNVNIINNASSESQVTKRKRSDGGVDIDVVILDTVKRGMGRGEFDTSLGNMYGLRRRGA